MILSLLLNYFCMKKINSTPRRMEWTYLDNYLLLITVNEYLLIKHFRINFLIKLEINQFKKFFNLSRMNYESNKSI